MNKLILLALLCASALAAPNHELGIADACSATKCAPPNCRCASTNPPAGVEKEQIPQFVFFTFDDAVEASNYAIYADLFYNKTNPDGCTISTTYFVSHEYTDYTKVHDLYIHGHEIALHSITDAALREYWMVISEDDLRKEFGGEKELIAKFANIPEDAIKGMRLPFLQLSADRSFEVAKEIGLLYDYSWPTQTYRNPGLWPYTLDYLSSQDCLIGPCPTDSFPGIWVVPMIDWTDQANRVCSTVDACLNTPETDVVALTQWFIDNFNVQYRGNKAPFSFYVQAGYFDVNPLRLQAYKQFISYLLELPDVYLVNPTTAIEWIKNPIPLESPDWPACPVYEDAGCSPLTCILYNENNFIEYMTFCGTECPASYPWINDPLGEGL